MIRLENTTGNAVHAAITAERHRMGSPATGMVLTLLVLADESTQADAANAASYASQEHPMRILVLVPRKGRGKPRLDAQIAVGGDDGPGEIAVLRLHGELANHGGSVAIPLLLTDTPVVAWWPKDAPTVPADDAIGIHAQRRITNSTVSSRQLQSFTERVPGYRPGDTDLSWTQLTGWRTLLATALDVPHGRIVGAEVSVQKSNVAGHLLAAWLHSKLHVPANVITSKGPGITSVRLLTEAGEISIARPDGQVARLTRTGLPPASIALPRRTTGDLLAEELRRLDPDEIYGETLLSLSAVGSGKLSSDPKQRPASPTKEEAAKKPHEAANVSLRDGSQFPASSPKDSQ